MAGTRGAMRPTDWTSEERHALGTAVLLAPSVHNLQPWRLNVDGSELTLYRRWDLALHRHDPSDRDIMISCGTALANLDVTVRALGRRSRTELLPVADNPDVIATIHSGSRCAVADQDRELHAAVSHRRSHRTSFTDMPVPQQLISRLTAVAAHSDTQLRIVHGGEHRQLACALELGWRQLRHNPGYQRELQTWTIWDETAHRHGAGIARSAMAESDLPWAGLARAATPEADEETMATRLAAETLVVVVAPDDSPRHQLLSGWTTEIFWLAAVGSGLVAAMITQPLHVPGVRDRMIADLGLAGTPHVLLRVGYPHSQPPQSPRRPLDEVLA